MKYKVYNYNQNKNVYYTVCQTDNFDSLSKVFGVPIDYIKKINGAELYVGKVLFLPETKLQSYVVKPFDTLSNIAKKYNTSIQNIKNKNCLQNDFVFVGQKLYL